MLSASASMRWAVTSVRALICGFTRAISSSVWRAISGAQFAIVQRTLEIGNGEVLKSHALYTPQSPRAARGIVHQRLRHGGDAGKLALQLLTARRIQLRCIR